MKEQQAKGYICPSKSPYVAPFFIKKKDGKLQPVLDYWWLNEWTIKNHQPLPLISELIAWIQNVKIFTKLNIRWGYNNIHIKMSTKLHSSQTKGCLNPLSCSSQANQLSSNFQTMMNVIFAQEIAEGWLIIYMDNILIATRDDPKFHKKMHPPCTR